MLQGNLPIRGTQNVKSDFWGFYKFRMLIATLRISSPRHTDEDSSAAGILTSAPGQLGGPGKERPHCIFIKGPSLDFWSWISISIFIYLITEQYNGIEKRQNAASTWLNKHPILKTWAEHWVCLFFRTHNLLDIPLNIALSSCCQGPGLFKGNGRQYCCFWTSDRLCCAVKNTAIFKRRKWLKTLTTLAFDGVSRRSEFCSPPWLSFLQRPHFLLCDSGLHFPSWLRDDLELLCLPRGHDPGFPLYCLLLLHTAPYVYLRHELLSVAKVSLSPLSVLKNESSLFIYEGMSCIKLISQQIPNSIPYFLEFL